MNVRFDTHGAVAVLTLNRPDALNALNVDALRELRAHLVELREREDLRAAVLTGAGPRAFCAGADLKGTQTSAASAFSRSLSFATMLRNISVSAIGPGATTFTVMPSGASSSAQVRAIPIIAALVAE